MFYLAFDFSSVYGQPIIYRPRDDDSVHDDDYIYEHFFDCIKKDYFIQVIPSIDSSKKIFNSMISDVKE